MLVITRKDKEGFAIYAEDGSVVARIAVVKTLQGKAQIGIEAAPSIKILRDELEEARKSAHKEQI